MNKLIQEQALIAEARFMQKQSHKRNTLDVSDISKIKQHIKQLQVRKYPFTITKRTPTMSREHVKMERDNQLYGIGMMSSGPPTGKSKASAYTSNSGLRASQQRALIKAAKNEASTIQTSSRANRVKLNSVFNDSSEQKRNCISVGASHRGVDRTVKVQGQEESKLSQYGFKLDQNPYLTMIKGGAAGHHTGLPPNKNASAAFSHLDLSKASYKQYLRTKQQSQLETMRRQQVDQAPAYGSLGIRHRLSPERHPIAGTITVRQPGEMKNSFNHDVSPIVDGRSRRASRPGELLAEAPQKVSPRAISQLAAQHRQFMPQNDLEYIGKQPVAKKKNITLQEGNTRLGFSTNPAPEEPNKTGKRIFPWGEPEEKRASPNCWN